MARASLRLPPLPSIGDLLRLYNLRAIKALSQNFLLDTKLASKVVSTSGKVHGSHVIEVGPGPGCLTRCILEQGASRVDVIEKDKRFIPVLEHLQESIGRNSQLGIHHGDIRKYELQHLIPNELAKEWEENIHNVRIIGNLPFNVSTPLIIKWLKAISEHSNIWKIGRVPMTLTFQEEVAIRMVATANHIQRSRLSIMCQNWCHVSHSFTIPGRAFVPKPAVKVAVVNFVPRIKPIIDVNFKIVERVVGAVFSMRQKFCKRGIETLFPEHVRQPFLHKIMSISDVDPEKRPVQLTMLEFNRLVHAYAALLEENPALKKYHFRHNIKLEDSEMLLLEESIRSDHLNEES